MATAHAIRPVRSECTGASPSESSISFGFDDDAGPSVARVNRPKAASMRYILSSSIDADRNEAEAAPHESYPHQSRW